jgi:NAD+ kinase
MSVKKIGLVVKNLRDSLALGRDIEKFLSLENIEVVVDDLSAREMGLEEKACKIEDMDVDLIIALGGDGTILKTVSLLSGKKVPILGINFGTMGFLTEITPQDWRSSLEKILRGRYTVEEMDKLDVTVDGIKIGEALNEAVVMTSLPVKMLHLEVRVDGIVAENVRSDGVIISTQTGSTAYSMSAGGPILDPRVPAFLITPICPFKSGVRSLVVPKESIIAVKPIKPRKEASIVIDGEFKGKLSPEGEATFTLSKRKAYFVRMEDSFYVKVRERL